MTANEKAKELVEKFKEPTKQWYEVKGYWKDDIDNAQQCALICVDEILSTGMMLSDDMALFESHYDGQTLSYWHKVKKEINNL